MSPRRCAPSRRAPSRGAEADAAMRPVRWTGRTSGRARPSWMRTDRSSRRSTTCARRGGSRRRRRRVRTDAAGRSPRAERSSRPSCAGTAVSRRTSRSGTWRFSTDASMRPAGTCAASGPSTPAGTIPPRRRTSCAGPDPSRRAPTHIRPPRLRLLTRLSRSTGSSSPTAARPSFRSNTSPASRSTTGPSSTAWRTTRDTASTSGRTS